MLQNKDYSVWLPMAFSLFIAVGVLIGFNLQSSHLRSTELQYENDTTTSLLGAGRVEEILRYVENRYVDTVNSDALSKKAIDVFLNELDPHSKFISADELLSVNESLEGNFVGIGIMFDIIKDTILVLSTIPDGPSAQIGILAGDKIVAVDDSTFVNVSSLNVMKILKGEEGSEVKITVERERGERLDFIVKRRTILMHSVSAVQMLNEKTGMMKIRKFTETTYDEFMDSLDTLMAKGMQNLVLDLRANPGGYLQQSTRILNQLIKKRNQLLVYTEGTHSAKRVYETKGLVKYDIDNIVVLIDEGSASASEIIAGAIQDNDRGVIIGRKSFGKGLVQEQYNLSDGSALRLTIARYYTTSGRLIQKAYGKESDTRKNRHNNGALYDKKNIVIEDSTAYFTKNGRIVYGGVGIIPDVFIPLDSLHQNLDYLYSRYYVRSFVYEMMTHKKAFYENMGFDNFVNKYVVDDEMLTKLIKYIHSNDNNISTSFLEMYSSELKLAVKEYIASLVFGDKKGLILENLSDEMVLAALEIIEETDKYLQPEM